MSACINSVSEDDFMALATAAQTAMDAGDLKTAMALDKMARKANASLTNTKYAGLQRFCGPAAKRLTWTSVPSTLT